MSEPVPPPNPSHPTPPWYFLFLDIPFGAAVGYLSIAVPFWMEARHYSLDQIATVSAVAFMPHAFKLFWIPLLDLGAYRKVWYLAMAAATAALLLVISLLPDPLADLPRFTTLLTLLQAAATTCHGANNALMATTTRFEDKGRVGGFAMASNVGFTGLLGAGALLVGRAASIPLAGVSLAVATVLGATLALRIVEPRGAAALRLAGGWLSRTGQGVLALLRHLGAMLKDLGSTVVSKEGFTGLLICLAPVGCQALSNLFSGIAAHYQADEFVVTFSQGVGGGVASAVGAILGGYLADRMSRRVAYAVSGGLTALCALAMAAAPLTPLTYTWGTFTYLFAGGIAFATWAGMVLEMVGQSAATATKYALFNASANLAISYVTFLDGWYPVYKGGAIFAGLGGWSFHLPLFGSVSVPELGFHFTLPALPVGLNEARGALITDAGLTFAGIAFLVLMILVVRRPAPRAAAAATEA
jgi:MFS family permease